MGKPQEVKKQTGVGFAIQNDLVKHLEFLPVSISERLSLCNCIGKNIYAIIFSYHAPTTNSNEVVKEQFYSQVCSKLRDISIHDQLLFGDFNACVGCDTSISGDIIGRHGVGKTNDYLLLSLCSEYGLLITNTIFQLPNHHKTN
uniref:Endonuclease/exonuclease/phosphatase domain-containing protein n=1 Tax=Octopus bimaculoides TaxID=37653 RepID=A0A0L8HAP4_OCTBM